MYKIASLGLIAVLAAMIVPVSFEANSNDRAAFYGYSMMAVKDISGVTVFESGLHNEVLNVGVASLLDSSVDDAGDNVGPTELASVNSICINTNPRASLDLFSATNETITFAQFNANDGNVADTNDNCEPIIFTIAAFGGNGEGSTVSSTATFIAASDNLENGDTIFAIGICNNTAAGVQDFNCDALLFAMIDTSDVTVNTGETVDISYTLNLD